MFRQLLENVERTLQITTEVFLIFCYYLIDVTVEKTKASFQDLLTKIDTGNQIMVKELFYFKIVYC